MFHLLAALFWIVLGVVLLALRPSHPGDQRFVLGAVAAFLLALYNLVRWWSSRSLKRSRRQAEESRLKERLLEEQRRKPEAPIDPNFDFSEPPPPPG